MTIFIRHQAASILPCLLWTLCAVFGYGNVLKADSEETVFASFEAVEYGGWDVTGQAFGSGPSAGTLPDQMPVSDYAGQRLVNSYHQGDVSQGTLTSPEFTVSTDVISFLIGGGDLPEHVGIELLVDGQRQRAATGRNSESLAWRSWDVRDIRGRTARLRIFDFATGGWGHILVDEITFGHELRESAEPVRLETYRQSPLYYRERYRPQYHFTPEMNWMNDPNGLVWHDGEFHLFYQHNPHGNEWGHMSWGHAVSPDLLRWTHLPIALRDEYGVMAFSGSAVFDGQNTSRLGTAGIPPLIAMYTGHGYQRQTQDLAYSLDRGRTWTKYSGNPVLDLRLADFRDPKVFWHEAGGRWIMVVSLAAEKRLQLYGSADLKTWQLLSEIGPMGVVDKPNWECPDLFELPIENEPGRTAWVLEADMGSGSIAGGSGGEYFTGSFDGTRFVPDRPDSQWVDFGRDFYAPVSWNDVPEADGRRLWIGWMNNWQTCLNPTFPWRSAMSIPRELSLRRINGRLRLCQRPVRELSTLLTRKAELTDLDVSEQSVPLDVRGQQLLIDVELQAGNAADVGLRVLQGNEEYTTIGYDVRQKQMYVDRTKSGHVGWHPEFAGRHSAPVILRGDQSLKLQILLDSSSVEVFGNDGEVVITDLVFPASSSDRVTLFAEGGTARFRKITVSTIRSVWHGP